MEIADQIVLVTGASRGLGAAVARAFARQGARGVVVNYLSSEAAAAAVAAECCALNPPRRRDTATATAIALRADVTDPEAVAAMFAAAEAHFAEDRDGGEAVVGVITTVVNSALAGPFAFDGDARPRLAEIGWPRFAGQIEGAVRGALNTTQAALPGFKRLSTAAAAGGGGGGGGGRIINIGSNLVSNPVVPYHDYTAAKGALLALTRTTAAELGDPASGGVTCNMVSGGLLRATDASAATPPAVFDAVAAATPLRRVATPAEVADAVLLFASPWARAVTGQNLNVDGGLVMT